MKWLAIINPFSGGRKTEAELGRLLGSLQSLGCACVITRYRGHAEKIAREASGFDGLVAVGGDGTLHEVLNGLNDKNHLLAIVPAGTGNSLAKDLGVKNARSAIESIKTANWVSIDLLEVSFKTEDGPRRKSVSASTVALGYPVATTRTAEQRLKGLGGFCYPLAAVVEAFYPKRFPVQINYRCGHRGAKLLTGLLINNTRHVANFLAFPAASLKDGAFEVMELDAGCVKQLTHNLSVLSRNYRSRPASIRSEASVSIDLAAPQDLMIDGEIYSGVTNLRVQVLPRKLRCISGGVNP